MTKQTERLIALFAFAAMSFAALAEGTRPPRFPQFGQGAQQGVTAVRNGTGRSAALR